MKNKVCYIVLFILLFSFILGSQCFAVLDISVLPDKIEEAFINFEAGEYQNPLADFCEDSYFIIVQNPDLVDDQVIVYSSPASMEIIYGSDNIFISSNEIFKYYNLKPNDEGGYSFCGFGNHNSEQFDYKISKSYNFIGSNYDIYDSGTGDLVFQQPPQVTALAQIVEEVETEKTLEEIVLILPLIIVIVVSFLGLRKALKMLSTVLRQS